MSSPASSDKSSNAEVVTDRAADRIAMANLVLEQLKDGVIHSPKDLKACFTLSPHPTNSLMMIASCKFCNNQGKKFTSTTRLVEHLNSCLLIPANLKKALKVYSLKQEGKRVVKGEASRIIQQGVDQMAAARHEEKKQRLMEQKSLLGSMKCAADEVADEAIARWFYANGISFNAASMEEDSLYREMITAIKRSSDGYTPPGRKVLGGRLIDTIHHSMTKQIDANDDASQNKTRFGMTYLSDGWESCDSLPLINSAYVTANNGGVYIRSVDTSGVTKTAEYCASLMIEDIYAIGPQDVIVVCTDTCKTMEKAWGLVMAEFPWISAIPCVAHVLSLLMKDLGKIPDVQELVKEESIIVSWFTLHQKPLAIFRRICQEKMPKVLQLVKAGATRFGTNTLVGARLLQLRNVLQCTVMDEDYVKQKYVDKPDVEEYTNCEKRLRPAKGGTAKKLILDEASNPEDSEEMNQTFWGRVQAHVKVTLPILKMLKRHDSSAPTIGKVYHGWFELGQSIEKNKPEEWGGQAKEFYEDRWAYGHTSILAAAYMLDPEFFDHDFTSEPEIMEGFFETVQKIAFVQVIRSTLTAEGSTLTEEMKMRAEFISANRYENVAKYDHYPDIFGKIDDCPQVDQFCKKVVAQVQMYRDKKGVFGRQWCFNSASEMPAYQWWDTFGSTVPELQIVARLVLAQCPTASIIERVNSEFAFIKDRKRNRLAHDKADKLVAIFHNLRMLKKMSRMQFVETNIGWNDDDTATGLAQYENGLKLA